MTVKVAPDDIIREVDEANFKEELRNCQKLLVDSKLKRRRHKVLIFAIENLNLKSVDEKFDLFFNILKRK